MEKVCGIIVFFSVYQLAGLNNLHDLPILHDYHLTDFCAAIGDTTGLGISC